MLYVQGGEQIDALFYSKVKSIIAAYVQLIRSLCSLDTQ